MQRQRILISIIWIFGVAGCFTVTGLLMRTWHISQLYPSMNHIVSRLQTTLDGVELQYVDDLHEELKQMGIPNRVTLFCGCGATIREIDNFEGEYKNRELYSYHAKSYADQDFYIEVALPSNDLIASRLWIWLSAGLGAIAGGAAVLIYRHRKRKTEAAS